MNLSFCMYGSATFIGGNSPRKLVQRGYTGSYSYSTFEHFKDTNHKQYTKLKVIPKIEGKPQAISLKQSLALFASHKSIANFPKKESTNHWIERRKFFISTCDDYMNVYLKKQERSASVYVMASLTLSLG